MNNEAKNYIESKIDKVYQNNEIGFLILNRYKKNYGHWDFLDCEVKIVEFNEAHTFIEKINGEQVKGIGNRERLDAYVKEATKEGEYISREMLWHTYSLKESLSRYITFNEKCKTMPNLDKPTYTRLELKQICDKTKEINFEHNHRASERATNYAYGK